MKLKESTRMRKGISIALVMVATVIVVVAGIGVYALSSFTSSSSGHSVFNASLLGEANSETTYVGSFNYTIPAGTTSNNSLQSFSTTQNGTGMFMLSVPMSNIGIPQEGQGTFVILTSGICSGKVTIPYTFKMSNASIEGGANVTVSFASSSAANFTCSFEPKSLP